jgi:2-keto-4-pentenoate hydratase/2-oxohepta-3-ene-1,7-dioic acid hydratase in catechol pathway
MKILYFDDFRLGILKGDEVIDISTLVEDIPHLGPHDLINGLIERFDAYRPKIEAFIQGRNGVPVSSVRIRPPLPKPGHIDCMAVNYMEDGTRSAPAPINAFQKAPSSIIGHGDTMVLPDVAANIFEGEAEIALVIGKRASHIFGYVNFVDGSARGLGPEGNVFFQMKSRDTFAPIGPYIVTADEIPDPQKLRIRLWNNGQLMQDFNTDDMAHNIPRCVEWVTSIHTLEPGDILATGTNHRGLNPFMDGDSIDIETEGLGRLSFKVRDDLKRTWARQTRLQREQAKEPGVHTPQLTGKYSGVK